MDELERVRRLWSGVPEPGEDALSRARAGLLRAAEAESRPRSRLSALLTRYGPGRARLLPGRAPYGVARRRRMGARLAVAGALAAALTAGPVVVGGAPGTRPGARDLLARAAAAAAAEPELTPKPGQYVHTVSLEKYTVYAHTGKKTVAWIGGGRIQEWLPAGGSGVLLRREVENAPEPLPGHPLPPEAWRTKDRTSDIVYDACTTGTPPELWRERAGEWPADPVRLRERLLAVSAKGGMAGRPDAVRLWRQVTALAGDNLRPSLRSALFTVAAGIDGVTVVPDTADAAGRRGIGVAMEEEDGVRSEMIFDRETYRYLGQRLTSTREHTIEIGGPSFVRPAGLTLVSEAQLSIEVVDRVPKPAPGASRMKIPC
ncbi:CU044_5270 family protein [Bailinhaonella thermotolerans]|uniref:CU044_5270 family protein n=1 Tax=Bailinhaonella thermotolerans TaxID=1070861 RepID=A0A3A4B0M1_9ACTN|nr:CU044_5270 family protein [Bailinhaonella thermotolerans]RJL30990.1 hypothetical protein D5H75_22175 [Bailinhaonella thermotolerans]